MINKPLITIVTVNYNTSDFIDLMLFSLDSLTKNSYKVIVCDNGSTEEELINLDKIVQKYKNIEVIFRIQSIAGSIGHAEALDLLIKKSDTKYTVVMDADCALLMKNWDQFLINQLDVNIKIIGTCEPLERQIDTKRVGKNFPLPFTTLFETEIYKELNLSCMPNDISEGEDTCWMWEGGYLNNGYSAFNIYPKSTRTTYIKEFNKIVGCDVYYVNDSMFSVHFGRGSTLGAAKYKIWFYRYIPIFSKIIRMKKGINQKKLWIQISRNIINKVSNN